MSSKKITMMTDYGGLPLSTTGKNSEGFYQDILDSIRRMMDNSLKAHSKVLFLLLTFSYPSNGHSNPKDNIVLQDAEIQQSNEVFRYFLNQYIRKLNIEGADPHYVWVRERAGACNHCHYHLALWLDANEIQYLGKMDQINGYWSQALANFGIVAPGTDTAGLIDRGCYEQDGRIQYYGMTVNRDIPNEYAAVFHRASYLAKVYSKDAMCPARTRTWGYSLR
jgi:hypothetical protein